MIQPYMTTGNNGNCICYNRLTIPRLCIKLIAKFVRISRMCKDFRKKLRECLNLTRIKNYKILFIPSKVFFASFRQVSSVTMPASLPLQLAESV